jgi:Rieske Fe-S protein
LAAGALAALGLGPAAAEAMPVRFGGPVAVSGDERTYAVPAADGATIDRDNQVILVRFEGKAYAFLLSCPHQNTALRWLAADRRFQCPRHESKYKPDGTFIEGRATRNMDRFAIRRSGTSLVVDLGRWYQSDTQKAEWAAAAVAV